MKIKVTYEKIFDAVEYTMSEDWKDCTFDEFRDKLVYNFDYYPEEVINEMKFEEIKK